MNEVAVKEAPAIGAAQANGAALALGKPQALPDRLLVGALLFLIFLLSADLVVGLGPLIRWTSTLFLGFALYRRAWDILPCALVIFFLYVGGLWFPDWVWKVPTAPMLFPFLLAWITCLPFAPLRAGFRWFRAGKLDQITWFLVIMVSLISAMTLVLWALWTDYLGLATAMLTSLKEIPLWFMLLIGIPGFALANAFAEEAVYRGVVQDVLEKRFAGKTWLILGAQASAFAAAHYRAGFPNGKLGYLMTFIYACMLGFLRRRSDGMLAPYLAHVAADTVIGLTLLLLAS